MNADIVEEFVEPGVSAQTIEKRPVFQALLKYLQEHRDVDYVIVYARSRAFRNFTDAAITRRHLDKLGVRLLSAREDFGEGTYAEAMEAVTDIMNQVQNQLSGEDIRIKMRNKAINGGTVGKAKIGYLNIRKDIDGRMINSVGLDETRAPLVLKAFELYATGKYSIVRLEATMADLDLTSRRTARYPEKPVSASRLHQMLKDPYYVGHLVYKGDAYPGPHEPIIGQDLFDQVQETMSLRSGSGTRDRIHKHFLKGMVYCGKCHRQGRESRLIYTEAKGRGGTIHEYFFCRARQEGQCDLPYLPAYLVEDSVADSYSQLVLDQDFEDDIRARLEEALVGEQQDIKGMYAKYRNQLREVEAKEGRLVDMAADGILPQSKAREKMYELRVQRSRIEDSLANIGEQIAVGGQLLVKAIDQIADPKSYYDRAPDKVRRLLNESFYQRFFVDQDGSVGTDMNQPFADVFAAQTAYRSTKPASAVSVHGSTQSSLKGRQSQPVNAPLMTDDGRVSEMVRDFGFTAEQQDQLWVQWRQRDSLRTIAMNVGTTHQKVRRFLLQSGGIRLPASKRNERHLSTADREEISRGIVAGYSAAVIAAALGRAPSTVSREIRRNGGREQYRAVTADQRAMVQAKRPKPQRLDTNLMLLIVVAFKLGQDWSPEQISHWLRRTYPEDASMRLSHEAIYRSIYIAERKALARCLGRPSQHLRSGRTMRVPRPARVSNRGRLKNMVSIHARPASIEEWTEVGHWEGDLVMGSRPSAVATLVDRKTRYVRLVRLPNGIKANVVRAALTSSFRALPEDQRLSLTWDRGRELAEHQELTAELGLPVYFCDKRSPWQRGTNENTNRLLRQYLPKNGDLRQFSQQELDEIADKINTRPRKVLDWGTSAHEFQVVARRDPQASRP